jgi:CBS domain-containing protein
MTVGRICNRVVATAASRETIRTAAQRMAATDVGTLVVLDGAAGARPVGIVTDRDVVLRCVAPGLDPDQHRIDSIMTQPLHAVDEGTSVEEALQQMAKVATRRLVVLGESGKLAGVLSLDDILDLLANETGAISRLLGKQQSQVLAMAGAR